MHQPKYLFGLIGKKLSHSFSAKYFNEKFEKMGLDARYTLFELDSIEEFPKLLETPNLVGLNVTVPYKQEVIPYLDFVDEVAKGIGAVNTLAKTADGWIGYNTDMPAFQQSLLNSLKEEGKTLPQLALVLGTGGSSAAAQVALKELDVDFRVVSRTPKAGIDFSYHDLTERLIGEIDLVINTTPLGMHPDADSKPDLPYHLFTARTLAFDLIYNPAETAFMKAMAARSCPTRNGLEMLFLQAEGAWEIWEQVTSNK